LKLKNKKSADMKNTRISIYSKSNSTIFSNWTDTLFVEIQKDGKISLHIESISNTEKGEKARTNATTEIKEVYCQLLALCNDQEWDLDQVINSIPSQISYLGKRLKNENEKSKLEQELEEHRNHLVSDVIDSAVFLNEQNGLINRRLEREKVCSYISEFITKHNMIPSGKHLIEGVSVTFQLPSELD
jgi:hypothetical protein